MLLNKITKSGGVKKDSDFGWFVVGLDKINY